MSVGELFDMFKREIVIIYFEIINQKFFKLKVYNSSNCKYDEINFDNILFVFVNSG